MSLTQLFLVLLAASLTLLASIAAVRFADRIGLPALLGFLALGLLLGEDALGINFDDAQLTQNVGMVALALILIDGGLTTRWADVRALILPAGVLATLGVLVSAVVVAVGGHFLVGLDWRSAMLLGAIVSSTDAAAVFSVLRRLPIPGRVSGLLEAESGFNDAPTVILVLLLSAARVPDSPWDAALNIGYELSVGAVLGLLVGMVGAWSARRIALPASGLYPLVAVGFGMVSFAAAGTIHASGFLAAYLTAMVMGNSRLPHRAATRSFAEGAAWLSQIGLFVMLGLLVDPSDLPPVMLPAIFLGAILLLVARPVSVAASLVWFRIPWREQVLISVAGLRGAVPIVLATIPVVAEVPDSLQLLNMVFVLVVVFTVVQGPSLAPTARLLGLASPGQARDVEIESAPLDVLGAALLTVVVPERSRLHGLYLYELRLPKRSVINSIVRDGRLFVPSEHDRLRVGDELMIVTMNDSRLATEARLRALGRRGRLARWLGETGSELPHR
ncbi:potassium/proton antiporter, CPA1 family (TC 2.A.36) [Stackebrandtia albiflava]|uniref:Potassium/proton antiporter, CPA1 family (TC 2.A.36) n=1 Tax=Stackebrandtia albiflava TaxID=406432 RepID=A0A562VEB1_9ACTN|nr:potassium/proton antiporter [Stackebrandtia albiflava]TWJ16184.1 potassium/proton antiporter, CPA1 family (TC 2.A.36) [Stackebrandtia albiflava]